MYYTNKPRLNSPYGYMIMIGDEFTVKFNAMGYHYEVEDIRKRSSMILNFRTREEAQKYVDMLISIASYYANKIKNNKNFGKALDDAKYELEKITSTNRSIIIPLIYDLVYTVNKKPNVLGLYDMVYVIEDASKIKDIVNQYEIQLKQKEEE